MINRQVESATLKIEAIQAAQTLKFRLSEFCDFVYKFRNRTTPEEEEDGFWMIGNVTFMINMIEQLTHKIDPDGAIILRDAIPDAHRLAEDLRQSMYGNFSMLPQ